MLHWIAAARANKIPQSSLPDDVLIDLGCGGGLMAPAVASRGYRHIGVDRNASALEIAARHGIVPVLASVEQVPLPDGCASVVLAGEILEHVVDPDALVAEICRLLRPGGLAVIDTLADTALARFLAIGVAERVPGLAPPGIHDPDLFVNREHLIRCFAVGGVSLRIAGLRPSLVDVVKWLTTHRNPVRMMPSRLTSVLFQGWGRKHVG